MPERWRLLADIGGTNIRFGLAREARPVDTPIEIANLQSWPCDDFDDFGAALRAYLAHLDDSAQLSSAAIAAAGPVTPDSITLTNRDWTITAAGLRSMIAAQIETRLLNDLEAVAYALPFLQADAIEWWDERRPPSPPAGRRIAVNVGTGFGSAAVLKTGDGWTCCPAESGHMQLGAANAQERAVLEGFGAENLTVEDVLSGEGACRLRQSIAGGHAQSTSQGAAPFDFAATDPTTAKARAVFSTILARTAGNLALASAAWDGVYLCGSVALAWAQHADRDAFRRAFAGSSKMRDRLAQTPLGLIRHPLPALVGLAHIRTA